MKKILLTLFFIQGILMGAILESVKIDQNEVPFIFEEDKNLPIVSMQLIFQNSGSLTDSKDGLAKLISKLLNQGTKKDGSVGFATKLENRAINLSAHTGAETFVIELNSLKSEFPYGVTLLKELLADPNYTEETLQKIKTKTIGELQRKESDFDYISDLTMKGMIFPDTPLAKPSLGTVKSVESITLADIQNTIHNHLGIENTIVMMGGDISKEEAVKLSTDVLQQLPHVTPHPIQSMTAIGKEQSKETKVDSEQAYIYFGAPLDIPYDSEERYLGQVSAFILGSGGFGSRMMEDIRVKKGLAYSAYSQYNINKSHSYFSGFLQTKVSSRDEAVKSVKEVVRTFIDKGVTAEELESAKQFILGSQPLRTETLSQRLSRAFQEYYTNRPLGATLEELKKIEKITLEEINGFIKKHQEISELSFSVVTGNQ